jgi:opacity protein-like surface antigen
MKTRTVGLAVLLSCLLTAQLFPQSLSKSGTTAAQFLKIGVGARAIGMGGAFTATADDITALYWNPAGLAQVYGHQAYFNHVNWFADVKVDYAAISSHFGDFGAIGAFVDVLSMEQMPVRTIELPEGTGEYFDAGGITVGVSYARALTDQFSIGFNAKYIRENIWHESAAGFGLDVGTMYRIPVLNELRLAASMCNFGTKMKMSGRDNIVITPAGPTGTNLVNTDLEMDEWSLPLVFRIGVAADLVKDGTSRVTVGLDAIHPNDNTESLNTGMEYSWNEIIFLRGGWKALFEQDTEQRFTLGAGFHYRAADVVRLMVDYAYQDWGRLKEVHYISFGVQF